VADGKKPLVGRTLAGKGRGGAGAPDRADQVIAVCYADVAVPDETTARLRSLVSTWRNCHGWPEDRLAEQIRADGVDILADLVEHTAGNRAALLARKPAPIQMLYLGYPCTSGLSAIDYLIADRRVAPTNLAHLYTEEVLALESCFLCYRPQPNVPEVAPLPALTNGHVTFGSYNNSPKLSATTMKLWAEVLRAVPRSRLAIKALAFRDAGTRALFAERFEAQGIARERIDLLPPTTPLPNFMAEHKRTDVALDPVLYNGGTTTCDALWMGVPVVTLPSEHFFSRMGLSVLQAVGLPELIAETPADYVRIAAELAGDIDRLADMRATMRARLTASSLCDGSGFTQRLEGQYVENCVKWPQEASGKAFYTQIGIPPAGGRLPGCVANMVSLEQNLTCLRDDGLERVTVAQIKRRGLSKGMLFSSFNSFSYTGASGKVFLLTWEEKLIQWL
jgi:protein O-GlcNAc transferase